MRVTDRNMVNLPDGYTSSNRRGALHCFVVKNGAKILVDLKGSLFIRNPYCRNDVLSRLVFSVVNDSRFYHSQNKYHVHFPIKLVSFGVGWGRWVNQFR